MASHIVRIEKVVRIVATAMTTTTMRSRTDPVVPERVCIPAK